MRTLCVTCHADVTAAQCAERRFAREMAKRQLKALMKNLKDAEESGEINGNIQVLLLFLNHFFSFHCNHEMLILREYGADFSLKIFN